MLDSISGINPYTSPFGMFGLGMSGTYGSYYNPMMMGMGPMGMLGMYNPAFMGQMNRAYQDIEKSQLNFSGAMHELMLNNQTRAYATQDRAIFEKAMVDAGVNKNLTNLAEKIREGDMDGVCVAYDELKQTLYSKYNDYFKSNTGLNPDDSVTYFIEQLYNQQILGGKPGESLRGDINKYGESSFEHGFMSNFNGKDYHKRNAEEALSYIYNQPIDNKAGKERTAKIGAITAGAAEAGAAGLGGAVLGKLGVVALSKYFPKVRNIPHVGKIMAGLAIAGDLLWQNHKNGWLW